MQHQLMTQTDYFDTKKAPVTRGLIDTVVRKKRLELLRREALEPKSSASTNSATFADIFPDEIITQHSSAPVRVLPGFAGTTQPEVEKRIR